MKARFALAAALALPLGLAAITHEYLPSKIAIQRAVKLGDGSVLPAGAYDVQIHYKGFGNSAELRFLQGGVFKGRTNAEARGFPSTSPGGAAEAYTVKLKPGTIAEDKTSPLEPRDVSAPPDDKLKGPGTAKVFPKVVQADKQGPAGAPAAFSWERFGFHPGLKGTASPGPPGMLRLSFDSANSPAGIIAILPYIEHRKK